MGDVFNSATYMRLKQLIVFISSSLLILVTLYLAFRHNTSAYWYLTIAIILIAIVLNFLVSKISDIKISKTQIVIENFYYGNVVCQSKEFKGITTPLISPPFYRLEIKNGKTFIFYVDSIQSFTSVFSKIKYADSMNDRIRNIIK